MFIIKHKKIFIGISIALVLLSIISLFVFGLKIGIDFKGGALLEVTYTDTRPEQTELEEPLHGLNLGEFLLQPTGEKGYIMKSRDLSEAEHNTLLQTLSLGDKYKLTETSYNSVGPSVGHELARKTVIAVILISIIIILFIAFAFRKVSQPVSSWKYGVIAIVTLLHDIIITIGIFTLLSHFYGVEVDTLFVVAILTVLGLSLSDTIVIFDRIRENLHSLSANAKFEFKEIVGASIKQSYARSICTSLTVILVLLALFFFGPVTTKYFALMMTAGMFFGTYSSIFLASPLLVWVEDWQKK